MNERQMRIRVIPHTPMSQNIILQIKGLHPIEK
jgi:hypothetical protein